MQDDRDIITRFKQVYFDEFGEDISDAEALEKLTRLTNVLRVLLKHSDKLENPDSTERHV